MKTKLLKHSSKIFFMLLAGGLLQACGGGMNISDQELVKKMSECHAEPNKTPGMAVSCGNYIEECKRRGEETGNYIC